MREREKKKLVRFGLHGCCDQRGIMCYAHASQWGSCAVHVIHQSAVVITCQPLAQIFFNDRLLNWTESSLRGTLKLVESSKFNELQAKLKAFVLST